MTAARRSGEVTDGTLEIETVREDFPAFYARERRPVIGLAYVLSGSRTGAEELAQEAFLAAFRRWDRISTYDDPGAWVRRVVANKATSRFRRRTAEARALLRLGGEESTVPPVDPDADHVWREVRRLSRRQAQVVALRYLDGLEVVEIAETLACSVNTVHTHLRRARETLARRLGHEEAR